MTYTSTLGSIEWPQGCYRGVIGDSVLSVYSLVIKLLVKLNHAKLIKTLIEIYKIV
jgi:hypothetical protein